MQRLRLPRLAGTRELVHELIAEQGLPASLEGEVLVALGADMVAASESFSDELVLEIVVRRGADELTLVGSPKALVEHCTIAAVVHGVEGRVRVRRAVEAGV